MPRCKSSGMGGRWITDILADNDPDDEVISRT
jgi:hypothetical protein